MKIDNRDFPVRDVFHKLPEGESQPPLSHGVLMVFPVSGSAKPRGLLSPRYGGWCAPSTSSFAAPAGSPARSPQLTVSRLGHWGIILYIYICLYRNS